MKEFMDNLDAAESAAVVLAGLPYDHNSSFMAGPADAPPAIREALHSQSSNMSCEDGTDLAAPSLLLDAGDLERRPLGGSFDAITGAVGAIIDRGSVPLLLGGDHSVTWPILRAVRERHAKLDILHFDAHPDLYDELEGKRDSHASPFARIMEEGLADRLVQVGIRSATPHQREQAERFGVETLEMKDLHGGPSAVEAARARLTFENPVYISFDVDVLDPAFAPGVSHFEPGGLSTRQAVSLLHAVSAPLITGADIVEYNPRRDPSGVTSYVCAKILKETASVMIGARG